MKWRRFHLRVAVKLSINFESLLVIYLPPRVDILPKWSQTFRQYFLPKSLGWKLLAIRPPISLPVISRKNGFAPCHAPKRSRGEKTSKLMSFCRSLSGGIFRIKGIMSAPFPEGINFLPLVRNFNFPRKFLTRLRNEVRNLLSTHTLTGLHACIHQDKWTRLYYGACEVSGKQTRFNFIKKFNFFNPRTEPYQSQTCLRFYCNFRCLENFQHVSALSGRGDGRP